MSLFITLLFSAFTCSQLHTTTHDKWIVLTTIQYPTAPVKKLASLSDWKMVVVGDKKTPKDWQLDNCIYLSPEDQQALPYQIIKHLPWNHYCRKNIGYLYAIEHGAKIIYETDDDNIIMADTIAYLPETAEILRYVTDVAAVNVYAHFGHAHIWPRGFPLSQVTAPQPTQFAKQANFIPIQQGVVNSDPDVDAIFRLTHAHETFFDETKPAVCLPSKTMCPFNSQNTVFYRSAFWSLVIPITTSFRVCDIWRGYWMQRLLWDISGSLSFLPPSAIQYRNAHNLLKDFADELDLYLKTEQLITALNNWQSTNPDFAARMQELMATLVDQGYFKPQESLLLQAWIHDLQAIGYRMPAIS